MNAMRTTLVAAACAAGLLAGCKKTADNTVNYKSALNTYYGSRPVCLWANPVKFPVQVTTSDQAKTEGFDALTDQGLLTRTTAEKKVFILGSKQVTNYDLSDKGRSAWTADTQDPGAGNFCYGKISVSSIDNATPTNDQPGATTTVNFRYQVSGAPGWATAPETETAFPQVQTVTAAPVSGSATLTDTNNGWAVTQAPQLPKGLSTDGLNSGQPVSPSDGKIAQ
jgi:hypothetical protein